MPVTSLGSSLIECEPQYILEMLMQFRLRKLAVVSDSPQVRSGPEQVRPVTETQVRCLLSGVAAWGSCGASLSNQASGLLSMQYLHGVV